MEFEFLEWLGHASFVFEHEGKVVYIDPFMIQDTSRKADVIFVTHPHPDHLSPDDIKKISKPTTKVIVTKDSTDKVGTKHVTAVMPNEKYVVDGIKFSTIPAYNTATEKLKFHPKENNWVGYIIETNNKTIFHAGDTDGVPEMEKIKVDLALLPMGGGYTMATDEMITVAKKINAVKIAPIHYRRLLGEAGTKEAEKKFLKEIKNGIILNEDNPAYGF
jgi:L-ascorbate metabolism protein UlaG (beta-lactamase superfamily)